MKLKHVPPKTICVCSKRQKGLQQPIKQTYKTYKILEHSFEMQKSRKTHVGQLKTQSNTKVSHQEKPHKKFAEKMAK